MASSSSARQFDVFLSFRAVDTRNTIVGHLYSRLQSKGILTFKDDRELPLGGSLTYELPKAIHESKIAVVVISQNYASSRWCLKELQIIMGRHKEGTLSVVPIFYGVDPSHVKYLRENFAVAFQKYQGKEEPEHIQNWRDALSEIGGLSGVDSRNCQDEATMVNDIVTRISKRLLSMSPEDTSDIIGMDAQLEALYPLLSMGSDDEIRMIGIWGMGGIGKTTIARFLYDKLKCQFPFCCFFGNIKKIYNEHGEEFLQRQFLYEILHDENIKSPAFKIDSNTMKDRLCIIKVLVILDDVDDLDQLRLLAKQKSWFGLGSRIIITTRDKGWLSSHEVRHVHEVKCLEDDTALKLFKHFAFGEAFSEDQIPSGLADLSVRASKLVQGLPLALKVLGLYLRGKEKEDWEDAICSLTGLPREMVMKSLKVSYNGLNEPDKDIFLTVACFFTQAQYSCVVQLLDVKEREVKNSLNMLAEKALIDISDDGKIMVHDLIQEMAKEIVLQQSTKEPGRRRFLWDAEEIFDVLEEGMGTNEIEGISLNMSEMPNFPTRNRPFENMHNLSFLKIYNTIREDFLQISATLNHLPPRLKLLDWSDCPLTALPSTFCANRLVELRLPYSNLEKLWEGTLFLGNLRRMDLSWCYNLKEVPSLVGATRLEELDLSCCFNLVRSPSPFPSLQKLARLSMRNCPRLRFPSDASGLKSLKVLDLRGCSSLNSFPKLSNSIMELYIGGTDIREVPETIQNMVALKILDLSNCRMLSEISSSIGDLTVLRELNLSDSKSLMNMPDTVGRLTALETFDLSGCQRLSEIPSTIGNLIALKKLNLRGCERLRNIPNTIGSLTALKELDLRMCENLRDIPDTIGSMTSLKELNLWACKKLRNIPDTIGNLTALKELNLNMCEKLGNIPSTIGGFTALETLKFWNCKMLSEIPSTIGSLTVLKELYLWNCKNLRNIPSTIGNLVSLKELYLWNCENLWDIPDTIGNLRALKYLYMLNCENLKNIPDTIGNLTSLERLLLSGCTMLSEIPSSIGDLTTLKDLDLSDCEDLMSIPESIGRLNALETLGLSGCQMLSGIPSTIGNLTVLKELNLSKCENLRDIPSSIGSLTALEILVLSDCMMLVQVPSTVGHLMALEGLDLRNCKRLSSLPDTIGNLTALKTLVLSGCEMLSEILDTIGNLTALETLGLSGCSMLSASEIRSTTANLTSLRHFSHPKDLDCSEDILPLKSGICRQDIEGWMEEEKISNLRRAHRSGRRANLKDDEEAQAPNSKRRKYFHFL